MDFSCVMPNFGLVSLTGTPALVSALRVSALSSSPLRRAAFSITCTLTPRAWAASTALSRPGSVKANILTRSVFCAPLMASRIGWAVSSGRTMSVRDMGPRASVGGGRGRGRRDLDTVQIGVDPAEGDELVVLALLGHDAALEHDDLVGVADGAQAVRDGDHGAALHEPLERLHHGLLRLGVER